MKVLMISRPTLYSSYGGDTVQIVETANQLRECGITVDIKLANEAIDYSKYDLIHFFNVIRPNTILPHINRSRLPYVLSTVYVDYSEVEKRFRGFFGKMLFKIFGANGMEYLKTFARALLNGDSVVDKQYFLRGHKKSIEKVLNEASVLLPNSHSEFKRLKENYSFTTAHKVVPNGVAKVFLDESFDQNRDRTIICIARIELIKNQLNLIKAVNGTGMKLKLIGQSAPNHKGYEAKCREIAGENVEFLGQLTREEIIQELKKAKVHVLPSWFETTGLSSLEAASLGCNIVVSSRGDIEEYFEKDVIYCNPESVKSIREALQKAMEKEWDDRLRKRIQNQFTWEFAAKVSIEAYKEALSKSKAGKKNIQVF